MGHGVQNEPGAKLHRISPRPASAMHSKVKAKDWVCAICQAQPVGQAVSSLATSSTDCLPTSVSTDRTDTHAAPISCSAETACPRGTSLHSHNVIAVVMKRPGAEVPLRCETPGAGHVAVDVAEAAAFVGALLGSDACVSPGAGAARGKVLSHVGALRVAWAGASRSRGDARRRI